MSAQTKQILKKLRELSDSDIAAHSQRFFKTGKGEYGEGDRFLGIRVPTIRKCVREYRAVSLEDNLSLLKSPFHEARLLALLILVAKYSSTNMSSEQEAVYRSYLSHTKFINNWDLVDCSAEHIVGAHLFYKSRKPIYRLVEERFLKKHYKEMPRTMLRYAIEKLPEIERLAYLHGKK